MYVIESVILIIDIKDEDTDNDAILSMNHRRYTRLTLIL